MYGQIFTVLLIAITFGSGMVLLNACVLFYLVAVFIANKFFILKYHQKSHVFNEDIPIMSIFFLKIAIIFHVVIGFYSLTENEKISVDSYEFIKDMRESSISFLYNKKMEGNSEDNMSQRLSSNAGYIYSLFIQLLIIAFVIQVIFRFIKSIL